MNSPSKTDNIDTSSYKASTILLQTNATIIETWCFKDTMAAISTPALTNVCQSYIKRYYTNLVMTYSITVLVIVIKFVLKKLVVFIAKFQKYQQQTQQFIDIVKNLVIIYILTTVVIGFLLQAELFGIQFKLITPKLINNQTLMNNASKLDDYDMLQNDLYIDIGYQIWLTWLMLAISPHLYMPLYFYLMQSLNFQFHKEILQLFFSNRNNHVFFFIFKLQKNRITKNLQEIGLLFYIQKIFFINLIISPQKIKMEHLEQIKSFIHGQDFFWYHGYGLTFLWIVASSIGILAKKINVYLHALIFFVVDVFTLFLVGGALYRYLPKLNTFAQWSLVKQLHIGGGLLVLVLVLLQHIGGVSTLLSASKKNPTHKNFAFWVANLARIIVVLGWILNGNKQNILYASIVSAVLLLASFYNAFLIKNEKQSNNPEDKNQKNKST